MINLREEAIVYSHPRSGLHMLCLGLYIIGGHNTDLLYDKIWASSGVPSHNHFFQMPHDASSKQFIKHILLLRDYYSLYSASPGESHLQASRARPSIILPGTFSLKTAGYVTQIKKFDSLKNSKMVVYFEDLIENNQIYLDVADFLGIQYDEEKIDFKHVRTKTRQLYHSSGHSSSKKIEKEKTRAQVRDLVKNTIEEFGPLLFGKYLGRYEEEIN